jgi:spermidine/putrescine transport system substrate-binding protein
VPVGAPHPGNAHKFINYLLDARAGAAIARTIQDPTPNAAARALMDDKYKNNAVIFPPAQVLAKCEYALYEGEARADAYAELLARVRAA